MSIITLHELKTWLKYFVKIWNGKKTFEIRWNDRNFKQNDLLLLREYNNELKHYKTRAILCLVTYIIDDPKFVKEGFVVMSIEVLKKFEYLLDEKDND